MIFKLNDFKRIPEREDIWREKVVEFRKAAGLSQEDCAKVINRTRTSYGRRELGRKNKKDQTSDKVPFPIEEIYKLFNIFAEKSSDPKVIRAKIGLFLESEKKEYEKYIDKLKAEKEQFIKYFEKNPDPPLTSFKESADKKSNRHPGSDTKKTKDPSKTHPDNLVATGKDVEVEDAIREKQFTLRQFHKKVLQPSLAGHEDLIESIRLLNSAALIGDIDHIRIAAEEISSIAQTCSTRKTIWSNIIEESTGGIEKWKLLLKLIAEETKQKDPQTTESTVKDFLNLLYDGYGNQGDNI